MIGVLAGSNEVIMSSPELGQLPRGLGARLDRQAAIVANVVGKARGIELMPRNAQRHDRYVGWELRGDTLEGNLGRSRRFHNGRATMT